MVEELGSNCCGLPKSIKEVVVLLHFVDPGGFENRSREGGKLCQRKEQIMKIPDVGDSGNCTNIDDSLLIIAEEEIIH